MVSQRLGKYIEAKNISYYAFENSLEASRGSISKAVKEGKSIGSNMLEKILLHYPDLNPEWLLTGSGEMLISNTKIKSYGLKTDYGIENQQIPLYDIEAFAGLVPLLGNNEATRPIDYISIPNLPKCDGAVYITGDSMYPLLKSGDIVLYKQVQDVTNNIFWGEMYLLGVDMGDEEYVTVKYVHKGSRYDTITLVSENKYYQDKEIEIGRIRALAIVKASVRMNAMK
ncbi:S24 family peptidase [Flavobacterium sp. MK4S-17]|uniref:S24 family peptidase n=1 Tax=Flavobacterium sp. MK4S-17 TaxID=2543737 RepID=UPI0013568D91|nr:S24 family peptidase [Flavobacterium sp. MK4S-17]